VIVCAPNVSVLIAREAMPATTGRTPNDVAPSKYSIVPVAARFTVEVIVTVVPNDDGLVPLARVMVVDSELGPISLISVGFEIST
jgi:hypothetical protein